MSEPLCLDCLFRRGERQVREIKNTQFCKDCIHCIKVEECIDGCGKKMYFCDLFDYWQGPHPKNCMGYKKK